MEERENSEKVCQLCASGKLFFAPAPVFCSCCNARLKRGVNYYCTLDEHSTRYCFCNSCYKGSRRGNISFHGIRISKATLGRKKNDEETEESWVQCDKCKGWQHQICAVLNDNSALEGKVENTCLKCLLKETEYGELKNLPKSYIFSAKDLPTTMLSDHIEQRLFRRLMQEREERAKVQEKEFSEIRELLDVLQHATTCNPTKIQPCFYPNCLQMKKLLYHADKCTVRATGGCHFCKKAWSGLILHSMNCRKLNCTTPRCMDLKKHAEERRLKT